MAQPQIITTIRRKRDDMAAIWWRGWPILDFYNRRRPHSSLSRRTPDEAYFEPTPVLAVA
jgi:hypothetical protein